MKKKSYARIAIAGNPNCGKTTIFNALTGRHQNVGNYPGVTVEKRSGVFRHQGSEIEVSDLPGTYSLSPYSPEERIAQRELTEQQPDLVVVVVDSTALSRSLALLVQIMGTGANPVLCLNMADEAEKSGLRIDMDRLQSLLGFSVISCAAHKGRGLLELKDAIVAGLRRPVRGHRLARIEPQAEQDRSLSVSQGIAHQVQQLLTQVTRRPARPDARAQSDRVDRVLAHRWWGIPIFLVLMYVVFWLTFVLGEIPMTWLERGIAGLANQIAGVWPAASAPALRSLLLDGVVAGVGGVVVFLPNIILLFFGLALLEDTGYMARAAFLLDRLLQRFGLHGKSFLPLLTGFGCSIPGIMATRTLENERDRLITMLVLPLMSCGARLPIWMLLVPAFFPAAWRAPALWLIYLVGILVALVLAVILSRSILKGIEAPFVMELPPYRLPTGRALMGKIWERSWMYLRKAGTVILGFSVLMWFVSSYPQPGRYRVDDQIAAGQIRLLGTGSEPFIASASSLAPTGVEWITTKERNHRRVSENLAYSFAGRIGRWLEPVVTPLGFDWKLSTAMIGAFAAKEIFVAQLGIVYSLGEVNEESLDLRRILRRDYSPLVGISLMLFLLIATPCMATCAVTRRESGSWKWALLQFGGLTAVAYVLSWAVYQTGQLIS